MLVPQQVADETRGDLDLGHTEQPYWVRPRQRCPTAPTCDRCASSRASHHRGVWRAEVRPMALRVVGRLLICGDAVQERSARAAHLYRWVGLENVSRRVLMQ